MLITLFFAGANENIMPAGTDLHDLFLKNLLN